MSNNRRQPVMKGYIAKLKRRANPFAKLPLSTLQRYTLEMNDEIAAVTAELHRLRAIKELVSEAMRDMEADRVNNVSVRVTDHAVLRYLERYMGFDTIAIEEKLVDMMEEGRPEVAVRDGVIATVLPEGSISTEHMVMQMANKASGL